MGIFFFEPMRLAMQSNDLACRQCQIMMAASLALFGNHRLAAEICRQFVPETKPQGQDGADPAH